MSETQLLTVALTTGPTLIVILIGILINNARVGAEIAGALSLLL